MEVRRAVFPVTPWGHTLTCRGFCLHGMKKSLLCSFHRVAFCFCSYPPESFPAFHSGESCYVPAQRCRQLERGFWRESSRRKLVGAQRKFTVHLPRGPGVRPNKGPPLQLPVPFHQIKKLTYRSRGICEVSELVSVGSCITLSPSPSRPSSMTNSSWYSKRLTTCQAVC